MLKDLIIIVTIIITHVFHSYRTNKNKQISQAYNMICLGIYVIYRDLRTKK